MIPIEQTITNRKNPSIINYKRDYCRNIIIYICKQIRYTGFIFGRI